MRKYEKRFKADGSYVLWQFKTVWKRVSEDANYDYWVAQGAEVTVIPYIIPTPITFEQLKLNKLSEIKSGFLSDYQTSTVITTVLDPENEFIVMDGGSYGATNIQGAIDIWENDILIDARDTADNIIKDANNNFHIVTLVEMKQIVVDILKGGKTLFAKKWTLEATVNSYTEDTEANRAAIKAINW